MKPNKKSQLKRVLYFREFVGFEYVIISKKIEAKNDAGTGMYCF